MNDIKTDVRNVFITAEVAKIFDMTPSYILRVAQSLNLDETEMRDAGKRNVLFSKEAVEKIRNKLNKGNK
jgi:hypothetical protein